MSFVLCKFEGLSDPNLFVESVVGNGFVPAHSTTGLINKHYIYIGNLISMSIVQGGPGPTCFADWVYDYMVHGIDGLHISKENIPLDGIKAFVSKVSSQSINSCSSCLPFDLFYKTAYMSNSYNYYFTVHLS